MVIDSFQSYTKSKTIETFRANGKLLISGEYFVLDGSLALALPTRYGQDMFINQGTSNEELVWKSYDYENQLWFEGKFDTETGKYLKGNDDKVGQTLSSMFSFIVSQEPEFLAQNKGVEVKTKLDFPNNWGLGSSSTFITNLANWAEISPYDLLFNTMGGSGYDIACAQANGPILYQIQKNKPLSRTTTFNPSFKSQLFFVFLGQKQNSRKGIQQYKKAKEKKDYHSIINRISILTQRMLNTTTIREFIHLMKHHEEIISSFLDIKKVQEERFNDFNGAIKSLGAWGGDFVLVGTEKPYEESKRYFKDKGYPIFLNYDEIIL